jgi:hypothetical protein
MLEASRLGIAAFIVPIAFVFQPGLLMIGSPVSIVVAVATAALGLIALSAALAGHLQAPLGLLPRLALFVAAACLISPGAGIDLAGAAIFAAVLLWERLAPTRALPTSGMAASEERIPAKPPGFFGRWLARRVAREEEEAAEEMAAEGASTGGDAPFSSLEAWLRDDRITGDAAPADSARWSAWAVLAVAVLALGYMGAHSWHATRPLLWLGALFAVTLWIAGGLLLTLRPVLGPSAARVQRA